MLHSGDSIEILPNPRENYPEQSITCKITNSMDDTNTEINISTGTYSYHMQGLMYKL